MLLVCLPLVELKYFAIFLNIFGTILLGQFSYIFFRTLTKSVSEIESNTSLNSFSFVISSLIKSKKSSYGSTLSYKEKMALNLCLSSLNWEALTSLTFPERISQRISF